MTKPKPPGRNPTPVSEPLRKAIVASGLSANQLGLRAGIDRASITRFLNDERGLSQDAIDRLADALGFKLCSTSRRAPRSASAVHQNEAPGTIVAGGVPVPTHLGAGRSAATRTWPPNRESATKTLRIVPHSPNGAGHTIARPLDLVPWSDGGKFARSLGTATRE